MEKVKNLLKNKRILALIIAIVVLIIGLILFLIFKEDKDDDYKDAATYSESFFIRNSKGKYALYNKKGKALTKFIYTDASDFVDGAALITLDEEGYSVINEKGKQIIALDKYSYIRDYKGLYKARKDGGYDLLSSNGKVVLSASDLDVDSYGYNYPFALVEADNKYAVVAYDGKMYTSFDKKDDDTDPSVDYEDLFASIFYENKNIILNLKTKKIIATINSNEQLCISGNTEDGKIVGLNTCSSSTEDDKHYLINNKNIIDLSKKCNSFSFAENDVICIADDEKYLLDVSNKKAEKSISIDAYTAYVDKKTYAKSDRNKRTVDFYVNGKKKASLKDAVLNSTGKLDAPIYSVRKDFKYEYYDKNGEKLFDKAFVLANRFNENELAVVSENATDKFLINKKGEKVSNVYEYIYARDDVYEIRDNNLHGVLNSKGEEIIKPIYKRVSIYEINNELYAVLTTDENKYEFVELKKGKKLISTDKALLINEHYVKTSDVKATYYLLNGEKIYEEK